MPDKKLVMLNDLASMLRKGVDHIMVINQNGRAEMVFSRSDLILSKERQEIFFMSFRLYGSLLQEFDDEFGPVEHFVIHRGNAKMVSVPFDSYNVVMVMKRNIVHEPLINKIKEINESCNVIIPRSEPVCIEANAND